MRTSITHSSGFLVGLAVAAAVAFPQQSVAQEEMIEEIVTTGTRATDCCGNATAAATAKPTKKPEL